MRQASEGRNALRRLVRADARQDVVGAEQDIADADAKLPGAMPWRVNEKMPIVTKPIWATDE